MQNAYNQRNFTDFQSLIYFRNKFESGLMIETPRELAMGWTNPQRDMDIAHPFFI